MTPFIRRILCIDDDPDALRVLTEYLSLEGYEVVAAPDGASGIQMLAQVDVQLVITDLNMPGLSGMDVIEIVRKNYPGLQIMVVTGYGTIESVLEALHKGAVDYLVKPYLLEILKLSLGKAERQMEIEEHLRQIRESGAAPEGRHVLDALPQPAALLGSGRRPVEANARFRALFGEWGSEGPEAISPKLRRRLMEFLDRGVGEDSLLLKLGVAAGDRVLELSLHPVEGSDLFLLQALDVDLSEAGGEDGLEEAVLVAAPSGTLLWANATAADWFNLGEEDLPSVAELLDGALEPQLLRQLAAALPATAVLRWKGRLHRHAAAPSEVELFVGPVLDERLRRRASMLCLRPAGRAPVGSPWDRRMQAEEHLPLARLGDNGRLRWASRGLSRMLDQSAESLMGKSTDDLHATGAPRLQEHGRLRQPDDTLVQFKPKEQGLVALDIEEQKAKLFRASTYLSHLLGGGSPREQARLQERLEEVARTLVDAGQYRRAALYLHKDEQILAWGFAGYDGGEEDAVRRDPLWRQCCESVEGCRLRIGTASLILPGAAEGDVAPRSWEHGAFLTLPILDRDRREVGRVRLDETASGDLPNEAQIHLVELMLRHVALALDELELEHQVARSEARYQDLYENAKSSIFIVDAEDARILDLNREAEILTGFSRTELMGRCVWELHAPDQLEAARRSWLRTLQRESDAPEKAVLQRRDGSTIHTEFSCMFTEFNGRPVVQSFYRDVTEKQALEFSLIQSQKLAGLGQLSAGVAHELRNPLGIMNSSLFYINTAIEREDLRLPDQLKKHLGIMKNEVDRSRKIIENLLSFSRTSSQERERVDLSELLGATLDLVKKELLVNNIRLVKELGELPIVHLNLDELKQAFLNVILNATQAMPEGGILRIRGQREGHRVHVAFEDSGHGISKENLPNVLNPFFTTKEPGSGTGLGLSLTHSFIRRAGGDLTIESELGRGTTVRILLPVDPSEDAT